MDKKKWIALAGAAVAVCLIAAVVIAVPGLIGGKDRYVTGPEVDPTGGENTTEPTEETEPEATEPEETDPEATVPEETEPEETEPEETEPEETEPEETVPQETEPEATAPEETAPQETKPQETQPKATEPKATEPKATEPKATEPPAEEEPEPTQPSGGDGNDLGYTTTPPPEGPSLEELYESLSPQEQGFTKWIHEYLAYVPSGAHALRMSDFPEFIGTYRAYDVCKQEHGGDLQDVALNNNGSVSGGILTEKALYKIWWSKNGYWCVTFNPDDASEYFIMYPAGVGGSQYDYLGTDTLRIYCYSNGVGVMYYKVD